MTYKLSPALFNMGGFRGINFVWLLGLPVIFIYFNISMDILFLMSLFTTAIAIGTLIPLKGRLEVADKSIIQLALGLGVVGFAVWVSTFHNLGYKSLFLTVSLVLCIVRYPHIKKYLRKLRILCSLEAGENRYLFPIILVFFVLYIIKAAYPITQYDALTKHISIPLKILNSSNWDYNVIESVVYGDSAILSHMYFLYLLALGGTKALTLFNVTISFFVLFMLLRLARKANNSNAVINATALIYLSTPFIYTFSTILYVDMLPVFFVFSVLILLKYFDSRMIFENMYVIAFLLGCSIFAKQSALFFFILIAPIVIYSVVRTSLSGPVSSGGLLKKVALALLLFLLPFSPVVLIIWHKTGNPVFPFSNLTFKSIYYSAANFSAPFDDRPLGFNIASLLSIVFNTDKNTEYSPGGLGFYLLSFFFLPLALILKRERFFIMMAAFSVASYWVSTFLTCNTRYLMGTLILCIPVSVAIVYYLSGIVKKPERRIAVFWMIMTLLIIPNLIFIFFSHSWTFEKYMLIPDSRLTINRNESVLSMINEKNVRVLSNNDVFRGTFKGEFYTLSWLNDFFVRKLNSKEVTPQQFLRSFDYYLVDKMSPESRYVPAEFFSLSNPDIRKMLTVVKESDSHILYRIEKKDEVLVTVLSESFPKPLRVNVNKSEVREIRNSSKGYKIEIDAEKVDDKNDSEGRFQINWLDKRGGMVSVSLIPFTLDEKRKVYISPWIENVPAAAKNGLVYLTSHTEKDILIHSVRVLARPGNVVQKWLDEYNKKWPHLST